MPIAPDSEELTIKANGATLGGWEEIHVVRGVERLPSAFYIRMTDKFPGQIGEVLPTPGAACQIYLTGDLILTGYVDVFDVRLAAGQHEVLLKGRSKPEDLVDSAINGDEIGGWTIVADTIGEAARKLAKPFKIDVSLPDGDFPIPPPNVFSIEIGATGAQLLEEMARTTGSLVWDDPQGRLVISAVGTGRANTALVQGQNIEFASAVHRIDNRFSDYLVFGAGYPDPGTPFKNALGHAVDPYLQNLGRHRTRIIPWEPDDQLDAAGVSYSNRRALWEASRRFGRGNLITIGVTGWRDGAGKLWMPNTVVNVNAPACKVNRDLVISEVAWERGPEKGTTATLTCMPKEGLQPQPFVVRLPVTGASEPAPH